MPERAIKDLGKALKELRRKKHLTQDNLSDITAVSKKHIANIEKGYANASFEIVALLTKELGLSVDNIIYSDELDELQKLSNDLTAKLSACTTEQREIIIKAIECLVEEFKKLNQKKEEEDQ